MRNACGPAALRLRRTALSPPWRAPRGFALLLVLWTLVLLALLITRLTSAGRSEAQLTFNLRAAAQARAAADGGFYAAVFHLVDASAGRWRAGGAAHILRIGSIPVSVRVASEAGKINPNSAQPQLMAALLHQLGADTRTAASIAGAVADWRFPGDQPRADGAKAPAYRAAGRDYGPPGSPFQSLDELGLVLGMTPGLLAKLTPHLTLYHEGEPDPRIADPVVLRALREAGGTLAVPSGPIDQSTVSIIAATQAGQSRFARRGVVRLVAGGGPDHGLFELLLWATPDA